MKPRGLLFQIGLLCLLWAVPAFAEPVAPSSVAADRSPVGELVPCEYLRATDGDTIKVVVGSGTAAGATETRVRLTGIDAPEITDGTAQGFASAAHLAQACEDAVKLYLEVDDAKPVDRYGRTLAWIWAEEAVSGQPSAASGAKTKLVLLNARMVDDGFALIYPSDEAKRYFKWTNQ